MWQVTNIIQTATDSESPISALVVFPKSEFLLGPPALTHIKNIALLKLDDETVWMLVLQEQCWTKQRLQAAANLLSRVSREAFTKSSIERMLRKELGTRFVSVSPPPVDRVDRRQWEIEKVAFALVQQRVTKQKTAQSAEPEKSEWFVCKALRNCLDEALCRFVSSMDSQLVRRVTKGRCFDLRIYNYLAHRRYRQYRLQFAETFPGLLLTAVVAGPRSLGEDLRSIVDSGAPLIKGLATRWKVRPGVIRHLVGRASRHMGIQWSRDAKGLALALNALNPQDLPGDSTAEWGEFNRIVATGQRLFLRPVWESAIGLQWLRVCVTQVKRGDKQTRALWLPQWHELEHIDQLRAALTESLCRETADLLPSLARGADPSTVEAVDHAILRAASRGLHEVALLFSDALGRTQYSASPAWQIRTGATLMPLISEDFISRDGETRVTALTTRREFQTHGTRLHNCLRSTSPASIARRGKIGTLFIVGLFDAHSGKALSTAEIKAITTRGAAAYRLHVVQHTAMANRTPSQRCRHTLRELLLYCQTDEGRDHLKTNWRALQQGSSEKQPVNTRVGLQRALGNRLYDELLDRIRDTNGPEQAKAAQM